MSTFEVSKGFELWKADALSAIDRSPIKPETQLTITALVGVYIASSPIESRTSYDWRQAVLADPEAIDTLKLVLPDIDSDRIDETRTIPMNLFDPELDRSGSMHQQFFRHSVLDGMPEGSIDIPENEYYLAQTLGHCAYNFAVTFQPLAVDLSISRAGLHYSFPQSLKLIEDAT